MRHSHKQTSLKSTTTSTTTAIYTNDLTDPRQERDQYQTQDVPTLWQGAAEPLTITTHHDVTITGTAASPGQVTGRARVVIEPDDADVDEGEILVARDTDPSWASLMFLSAGLIADIGGVMSHTAIVARELSIPCVVNTKTATTTVRTGDLIRIDGTAGTIEILERTDSTDAPRQPG